MKNENQKTFEMKVRKDIHPKMLAAISREASIVSTRQIKGDEKFDMFKLFMKDDDLPDEFVGKTLDVAYNGLNNKITFYPASFLPNIRMGMINYIWANNIKYITEEVRKYLLEEIRDKHWCYNKEHGLACIEDEGGELTCYHLDTNGDINNAQNDIFTVSFCPICGQASREMIEKRAKYERDLRKLASIAKKDDKKVDGKVVDFNKAKNNK